MSRPWNSTAPTRRRQQQQQHPAQRRLAAAGFAEQPDRLAFADREIDAFHGAHRRVRRANGPSGRAAKWRVRPRRRGWVAHPCCSCLGPPPGTSSARRDRRLRRQIRLAARGNAARPERSAPRTDTRRVISPGLGGAPAIVGRRGKRRSSGGMLSSSARVYQCAGAREDLPHGARSRRCDPHT